MEQKINNRFEISETVAIKNTNKNKMVFGEIREISAFFYHVYLENNRSVKIHIDTLFAYDGEYLRDSIIMIKYGA